MGMVKWCIERGEAKLHSARRGAVSFNTAIPAICMRGIIGRGECVFEAMDYALQYAFAVTSGGGFILGLPSIPVEKAQKKARESVEGT